MLVGHFGLAAVVKSRERTVPLWALMLATAFLDVIFVPLYLLGVEHLFPVPGTRGGYGDAIIHADYSHSLLGALVIAATFGLVAAIPWGRRVGAVLGAVVFSHWLLDLVVHRADLAILPGNAGDLPRLGFGLWQIHPAAAGLELALVVAGAFLYWRSALGATSAAREGGGRAHLVAGWLLVAGLVTLGLDLTS